MGCLFTKRNDSEGVSVVKLSVSEEYMDLNSVDTNTIPYFTFKDRIIIAKPCNVYDGDTFSICFKQGNEIVKWRCRCLGYDSPEMKPLLKNPNREKEKELAVLAKQRLGQLLSSNASGLVKVVCGDFDKYGRVLGTIYNNVDVDSINTIMIREGHGKEYDGGKKDTHWE
jgi:endonuclease YncB( thermonuclease family)